MDGFACGAYAGKINLERRAFSSFAVHPDVPSALLDNSIDRRKAEAGAFVALSCEERFEDMVLRLHIHAHACVADGEHYVLARGDGGMQARIVVIQGRVRRFDGESSA